MGAIGARLIAHRLEVRQTSTVTSSLAPEAHQSSVPLMLACHGTSSCPETLRAAPCHWLHDALAPAGAKERRQLEGLLLCSEASRGGLTSRKATCVRRVGWPQSAGYDCAPLCRMLRAPPQCNLCSPVPGSSCLGGRCLPVAGSCRRSTWKVMLKLLVTSLHARGPGRAASNESADAVTWRTAGTQLVHAVLALQKCRISWQRDCIVVCRRRTS